MSKDILKEIELKPLYGLTSQGGTKIWRVAVVAYEDGTAAVIQEYGKLNGKLITNIKNVREGKNISKSNETSPFEQAMLEAESKLRKKIDSGYCEDQDEIKTPKLPMLALKFTDHKDKIEWPAGCQRKYDGVRDLCEKVSKDMVTHMSRRGKPYDTMGHLQKDLLSIMQIGDVIDGEIYCPDLTFQNTVSAVKRAKENSLKLEYHVYDLADPNMDFKDRYEKLQDMFAKLPEDSQVKLVETMEVDSEEEVYTLHDQWVQEGFEGAIVRSRTGGYSFKHRSSNLLKYKEFIDEEFLVVGGYTGKGTSYEGSVTFECLAANGEVFGCVPKGPFSYKQELWNNLDNIVANKTMLTVRYQTLSDSGIPIFPIGISLRDYE